MPLFDTNVLVAVAASVACLALVVSRRRARGQRMRMILGGLGVAALMVAIALIVDRMG